MLHCFSFLIKTHVIDANSLVGMTVLMVVDLTGTELRNLGISN
jgi:hypothetical protein